MNFSKHFKKKNLLNLLKRYLSAIFFLIVGVSDQSSFLKGCVSVQFSTREKKKSCGLFQTLKKNPNQKTT